jgi:hypothetical protein
MLDWLQRPLPTAYLYGAERGLSAHTPGSMALANVPWVLPLYWRGLDRTNKSKIPHAISCVKHSLVQVIDGWSRHCAQAAHLPYTVAPETDSLAAAASAAGVDSAPGARAPRLTGRRARGTRAAPIGSLSRLSSVLMSRMPTGRRGQVHKGRTLDTRKALNANSKSMS